MQMGACELLMHYMDLKQTNDVQLTFEALKVTFSLPNMMTYCQNTTVFGLNVLPFSLVSGFTAAT